MANNRPQGANMPLSGNFPMQPRGMPMTYAMMPQPNVSILSNQSTARGIYQPQMQTVYMRNMAPQGAAYVRPGQPVAPEEHRRLEEQARKDWNFQLQQRRLRAFSNTAGQKSTATPDSLIKNMWGTSEPIPPKPKPAVANNTLPQAPVSAPAKLEPATPVPAAKQHPVIGTEETANVIPSAAPAHTSPESQRKNLDEMMLKYTDMSKSSRAHTFPKPASKETKSKKTVRATSFQPTPKTSPEMANDFFTSAIRGSGRKHNLVHKEKILHASRLPPWCFVENKIPDVYRTVLQTVTQNGVLDTSLLYPILISSGLHHDTLGHIWGLVNLTTPGQLMPHELNAALALVALAQNGCKFSGLEVLHSVPQPPIPFLQHPSLCPSPASQKEGRKESTTTKSPVSSMSSQPNSPPTLPKEQLANTEQGEEFADFLSAPPATFDSAAANLESPTRNVHCGSSTVGSRLANYTTVASTQPTLPEDTSPAPVQLPNLSKVILPDDDFSDFQHAENLPSDCPPKPSGFTELSFQSLSSEHSKGQLLSSTNNPTETLQTGQSLLSNNFATKSEEQEEDKYAVFRELEAAKDDAQLASSHDNELFLLGSPVTDAQQSPVKMPNNPGVVEQDTNYVFSSDGLEPTVKAVSNSVDDEFGEFLSVSAEPSKTMLPSSVHNSSLPIIGSSWTTAQMDAGAESTYQSVISPEFQLLQFQSAKSGIQNAEGSLGSIFLRAAAEPTDTDEFGDFMSPGDFHVDGDDSSLNNQSVFSKDTGSAESQSISSFELCTTDGFVAGSDLSRHGSVPSLDLKVMPETDEDYGDLQSSGIVPSCNGYLGPKPNGFIASNSPTGNSKSKTVFPIVDRYSCVRSDTAAQSDLERNVCEWELCLESCFQLIQGANDVFSNISSSTVCKEVLNSEEGIDYLQNIVEVYKLVRRVRLSIKTMAFENEVIQKLLHQTDLVWSNFLIFISPSPHMPDLETLDYSSRVLKPEPENNYRACGICLLEVGTPSHSQESSSESNNLLYGGRQYHATCANFWVNCVNSLLPALTLQQLL